MDESTRQEEGPEPEGGEGEVEILSIEATTDEGEFVAGPDGVSVASLTTEAEEAAALRAEVEELRDRALRTLADFDNFRKRAEREREELRRYAVGEALRELLPVLDNLERARAAQGGLEDLRQGVDLIVRQLYELLSRFGLRPIAALGAPFDPRLHEAVQRREASDLAEPVVVEELQRGFVLGDRLLRPAMVIVAMPAEEQVQERPVPGAGE